MIDIPLGALFGWRLSLDAQISNLWHKGARIFCCLLTAAG